LLTNLGPAYSTSIDRMIGGPSGACARADTAPSSAQMDATQIANGGRRSHPEKCLIS
jgi:hypothetical protein